MIPSGYLFQRAIIFVIVIAALIAVAVGFVIGRLL